jgi:hypothetical protein
MVRRKLNFAGQGRVGDLGWSGTNCV